MSRTRRNWQDIARGARVNFVGILARSLRAIYLVFVARLFGVEVLGLFLLSWTVVDVSAKLGLVGLDRGLLRFLPRQDAGAEPAIRARLVQTAVGIALAASLASAIALFLLAPLVARVVLNQAEAGPPLQILAWGIVPLALSSVLLAITRAERRMEFEAWTRSVIEPALLLGLALPVAALGWQRYGLYVAQLLALAGGLCASILFVHRLRLVAFGPMLGRLLDRRFWRHDTFTSRLASFSLPIGCYDLLAMSVVSIDFLVLARFVGPRELGIYGAAVQVGTLIKKARQAFEPALIPVLSQELQRNDRAGARESLDRVSRWVAAIDLGFLLVVAVFGGDILRLFGSGFATGALPLVLIALAWAVNGIWGIAENVVLLERPRWNLWNWVAGAPLAVGLNLLLIPRYGAVGAAASLVVVMSTMCAVRLWQARRLVGWWPFHTNLLVTGAVGFALGLVTWTLKAGGPDAVWFRVILGVGMVAVYAGVIRRIGGLTREDARSGRRATDVRDAAGSCDVVS